VIAPFLPVKFVEEEISLTTIGLIFAVYSVAVIVWSPVVGDKILLSCEVEPRKVIVLGMILMSICFFLFGMIDYIQSKTLLISAGIIIRILQGIASASIQTTCYTIAINDFKDKTI
jgi:MFS family permease